MYDLKINATTRDGTRLGVVYLPNLPADADKIVRIREAMMRGETIRPVILSDRGDHHVALSGSHRIAAAQGIDDALTAVYLPTDLTSEQWEMIDGAHDDDMLLAALREIATDRTDMGDVVEAMASETAANQGA